ncbi:MAG: hypothetical protein KF861_22110 [Planctomycetaceae bacterium]|nr:hypothetical protein [Planctomycetaceae bacterium]
MKEVTHPSFGLAIAYLIPGFLALWGASFYSPMIEGWLTGTESQLPTLGGFLYVTIASLGTGLVISTIRWLLLDTLHHHTGIAEPLWNFAGLQAHIDAFDRQVEGHYRYYQFYGNSLVALLILWLAWRCRLPSSGQWPGGMDLGLVALGVLLFLGSRDTLRKYYVRMAAILGSPTPETPSPSADTLSPSSDQDASSGE